MKMIDILAFKKIFFIYKMNIFFFLSLVALYLELFPAQAVITFLDISKSANINQHSLTLGCNVSETPSNVAISRKHPSPTIRVKKFNPNKATFLYERFELKNENCSNMAGQYECMATYDHKVVETKTLNVFRDDCQLILCDAKLDNSVTYANVDDDVNLTTCVWGASEEIHLELFYNQDRHSLKYTIFHHHNTTTKYRNITVQIMKLSSSSFGLNKMKIKPDKYANQSIVINFQILEKGQFALCDKKTNNSVISVTKESAMADFCVMSKEGIDKISINEQVLFDKVLISSDKYKLVNTSKGSKTTFKLHFLKPLQESNQHFKVHIFSKTKTRLEYRFSLIFLKDHPALCDGTSTNTDIFAKTNKATTEICVKPGDNISNITINDFKIFDHGLIQSSQYTLSNRTEDDKIYFTIEILNLTMSSPVKYVVKIETTSSLQLMLQFNIKMNSVNEITPNCFTTANATSLHVVNNTVNIYLCENETVTISNLKVNDRPINDTLSEYTIKNKTVGDNTQVVVEFSNLKNGIDRNVSFGVIKLSGQNIGYFFNLPFHNEVSKASRNTIYSWFLLPILGIVIFLVIIALIVYLKFKSKKRRQRYGQAYDNVTYKSSESMIRPGPLPSYRGSSSAAGRDSNRTKVPPRNRPLRK
ncbi:unnamed protein product [Lymnaea stagnalis]|uniref:Uncharacterized protein n=1 Tax=Lymnaea stagnalis TaxID=6523 RepID=A0AAV2HSU8_LYMST